MLKYLFIVIFASALFSCSQPRYEQPHVLIETGYGDIELELYPDKAPQTMAAFLSHVDKGLYDGTSFYRVVRPTDPGSPVKVGVIQGGIFPHPDKPRQAGIPHETTRRSGLTHEDGIVSLARTEPGTGSTEFFICIGDQSPLDSGRRGSPDGMGYAAFGKVFKGMKVVRKIQELPGIGESFDKPVRIDRIRKL